MQAFFLNFKIFFKIDFFAEKECALAHIKRSCVPSEIRTHDLFVYLLG